MLRHYNDAAKKAAFFLACAILSTTAARAAPPAITPNGIVSSASFAPALSVGGVIAQGSLFSIFGTALGPATPAQPTAFPLGNGLGGTSVQVIAGTTTLNAIPLYASAGLVNAIMPSNTPLGNVSVQVTYNGAVSAPQTVTIAANAPGIYTATGAGSGPGILQNFTPTAVPVNSASATVKPGQTGVLWLTGLGPIAAADNQAPPVGTLSFPVEIWVGGQAVTSIQYSGRTPCCAGVDEIVFTVPAAAPSGCYVPVTMRVAGKAVSNTVTIAVDPQGNRCTDAISAAYTKGGKFGTIALIRRQVRFTKPTTQDLVADVAMAGFSKEAGAPFAFNTIASLPPAGSCLVYQGQGDFSATGPFSTSGSPLNAGTVSVKGPVSTAKLLAGFDYGAAEQIALLGSSGILPASTAAPPPFLSPGPFTVSTAGGADVGAFSAQITVPNTAITWSNRDQLTTVDRSQPLTFSFSGTSYLVAVEGGNYDAPTNSSAAFRCTVPGGATSFTVPNWILANFSPSRINASASRGIIGISSATTPVSFQATGLDNTAAFYINQQSKAVTFK